MAEFWHSFLDHLVLLVCVNPLVGAVFVAVISGWKAAAVRTTAFINVVLSCVLAVLMVANYHAPGSAGSEQIATTQMETRLPWLGGLRMSATTESDEQAAAQLAGPDIQFAVGVDGISVWLVAMSALLMLPAMLVVRERPREHATAYYALLLLLQSLLACLFAAQDVVLFYVCLELLLVPLLVLTGLWGGYGRRRAARRFFLSQLAGGLLILLGLVSTVIAHHRMQRAADVAQPTVSFDIESLTVGSEKAGGIAGMSFVSPPAREYWMSVRGWIFACLLAGFAVKGAIFPFHTWLGGSMAEAPPAVRILLAAMLIKVGCYGYLRFVVPLFPGLCLSWTGLIVGVLAAGAVYAALLVVAETQINRLVAHWCAGQSALCAAGMFSLNRTGASGAVLLLIVHGLSAACLLFVVNAMSVRARAREIHAFGSPIKNDRRLAAVLTLTILAAMALPGSGNFAAQIVTLMGVFAGAPGIGGRPGLTLLLLLSLALTAGALLWLLVRLLQGTAIEIYESRVVGRSAADSVNLALSSTTQSSPIANVDPSASRASSDLSIREWVALLPCLGLIVWLGVYPQFIQDRIEPSVTRILTVYPSRESAEPGTAGHATGERPVGAFEHARYWEVD